MEQMLAVTVQHPLAAAAGLLAMVCFATFPLFGTRWKMLSVYIGNNLAFVVHYGLLGHWTAVDMNCLMALQTVVALGLERWPRLRWVYYALVPVLAAVSIATWEGLPSFLSATATLLSTIGRGQRSQTTLRIFMLSSAPVWLAHDVTVGSLPGLIADASSMATGTVMLLRRPEWNAFCVAVVRRLGG